MPRPTPKKTKSAPRRWPILVLLIVSGVVTLMLPSLLHQHATAKLVAGTQTYHLDIANTEAAREVGLSGRTNLADNRGMLFVFDHPQTVCMWMKDMRFSIDMVWVDEGKRVTLLESGVEPGSYPKSFCVDMTARYVVELAAGQAKRAGIKPGTQLIFR